MMLQKSNFTNSKRKYAFLPRKHVIDTNYNYYKLRAAGIREMTAQDVCLGTVIALLLIVLALLLRRAMRARNARADAAGAALVADVREMVAACEALTAVEPIAGASCQLLSRGLSQFGTDYHAIYHGLASPTELTAAAAAYSTAAAAATGPLAAALQRCARQLRTIVKSIHRLGAALDLE